MNFKLFSSLALFALCISISVSGQQEKNNTHTKVFYDFTFQTDSADENTRNTISTVLLLNDSVSVFQSVRKLVADSAFMHAPLRTGIAFRYGKIDGTQFRIWKHAGLMTTEEPLDGRAININNEIFSYEEKVADLDWVLEDDIRMLAGYQCQKATVNFAGRLWEAWFTSEIPIHDGPYKFSGLPGLVMLVQDNSSLFRFEFVGIKKEAAEIYALQTLRPDIIVQRGNKQSFLKQRITTNENMFFNALSNDNIGVSQRNNINIETRKHTNWIELL